MTEVCWLYCRRGGVARASVGFVVTPGARGNMYARGPCIAELDTWCASSRITGIAALTTAGSPPRTRGTRAHSRCTPKSNASATAVDAWPRDREIGRAHV